EEVAGLRQQALEPGEHRTQSPCLLARDPAEPAPVDRRLKLAGAERADQVPEVFLVDGLRGLVQRKPATLALPLFLPGVEFVGDREWKDVDVDHQRSAAALALAIAIAAERNRADSAEHSSFLPRLARGRDVQGARGAGIAFRQHPARLGPARGDQHDTDTRVGGLSLDTIRKGGDL